MTEYRKKYLGMIRDIVLSKVDCEKYMVFLFGSWATGKPGKRSDVDVGLWSSEHDPKTYHRIVNALDDSIIPLKVDVIEFNLMDKQFKDEALKNIIVWNKPKDLNLSVLYS